MSLEDLLGHVPPEVVYKRVPLEESQNALGPWQEAATHWVPPDEDDQLWGELIYGRGETQEPVEFPGGAEGDRIREILIRNQQALELFAAGVRRGRLQLPECDSLDRFDYDLVQKVRPLGRATAIRAKMLLADGDFAGVAAERVKLLRTGEMICAGEGLVVEWLMGLSYVQRGATEISRIADDARTPQPALADLLAAVEQCDRIGEGLEQSLRVDLRFDLLSLDQLPEGGNLKTLLDAFPPTCSDDPKPTPSWSAAEMEAVARGRARRRQQILFLLEGHPEPWDKTATAKLLGELTRQRIDEVRAAWKPRGSRRVGEQSRKQRGRRRARLWPLQIFMDTELFDFWDSQKSAQSPSPEAETPLDPEVHDFLRPISDKELCAARRRLRRVSNPFGLLMSEYSSSPNWDVFLSPCRTKLQETRTTLGTRLSTSQN